MGQIMNSYIIYARKSSEADDRQALSIESQLHELQSVVEKMKLSVIQTITEQKSAKAPGRTEFNKLIECVESSKANAILVWNSDRLARNSVDSGRLIYLFDIGKLNEIITPSQTFTNTPNDKFLLSILWGHAKLENDNKSVNVRRGLKAKAEQGWYPFRAVNGYLNTPDRQKGLKIITKDPVRFPLVRKMWDMLLSGNYTVSQIHEEITIKWGYTTPDGKKLARSALYELFRNPFYTGVFLFDGEIRQGKHESMITREEFEKAQAIISRKDASHLSRYEFAYANIMKCSRCGFSICGTRRVKRYKRTGRDAEYVYYRCSRMNKAIRCQEPPINETALFNQFFDLFSNIQIDKDFLDWANQYYYEVYAYEQKQETNINASLQSALQGIQKKLDTLLDMKLSGELTSEEYLKKKSALLNEQNTLQGHTQSGTDWHVKAKRCFDVAYLASQKFKKSEPRERKAMIREVHSDLSLERGKIASTLEKPYFLFKNMKRGIQNKNATFEPVNEPYLSAQTVNVALQNPSWYPVPDSNRRFVP